MKDQIYKGIEHLLKDIGDNPARDGLKETPRRFFKVWSEMTNGYGQQPELLMKTFTSNYTGPIVFRNISFYSNCEHHLMPMIGKVDVVFQPDPKTRKVVGFSKISRLIDVYARRLQIQERFTQQVGQAIKECLKPRGVFVITRAKHFCMEMRGLKINGQNTACFYSDGIFSGEKGHLLAEKYLNNSNLK